MYIDYLLEGQKKTIENLKLHNENILGLKNMTPPLQQKVKRN